MQVHYQNIRIINPRLELLEIIFFIQVSIQQMKSSNTRQKNSQTKATPKVSEPQGQKNKRRTNKSKAKKYDDPIIIDEHIEIKKPEERKEPSRSYRKSPRVVKVSEDKLEKLIQRQQGQSMETFKDILIGHHNEDFPDVQDQGDDLENQYNQSDSLMIFRRTPTKGKSKKQAIQLKKPRKKQEAAKRTAEICARQKLQSACQKLLSDSIFYQDASSLSEIIVSSSPEFRDESKLQQSKSEIAEQKVRQNKKTEHAKNVKSQNAKSSSSKRSKKQKSKNEYKKGVRRLQILCRYHQVDPAMYEDKNILVAWQGTMGTVLKQLKLENDIYDGNQSFRDEKEEDIISRKSEFYEDEYFGIYPSKKSPSNDGSIDDIKLEIKDISHGEESFYPFESMMQNQIKIENNQIVMNQHEAVFEVPPSNSDSESIINNDESRSEFLKIRPSSNQGIQEFQDIFGLNNFE